MSSEERLALRAAAGDRRAFEEIYERYHQELYRFCLAMVGNPQDAQDALQNTMVKVLRGLPGETRKIRLKPWLYRIARNESVETLRRRRDTVELEPEQVPVAAIAETAETRDRLRTLLADLDQLPERQRATLVMRELSGLDFDQIAATFGTSAAVARQTLYEARLSLSQLEAGREMRCSEVMRELSNADGRVTRRREIRSHLRGCAECRAFREDIKRRHQDLAALAPLPLAASAGVLQGVLGSSAGAGAAAGGSAMAGTGAATGASAGGGGLGAAGAGKAIATSAVAKSAVTAAVVTVIGVSAADRTGVLDLPLPGRSGDPATRSASPGTSAPVSSGGRPASAPASSKPSAGDAPSGDGATGPGDDRGKSDTTEVGKAAARPGSTPAPTNQGSSSETGPNPPSERGQNPPGAGRGRSAAGQKGQPDQPPAASAKGQQTAAAHKPPHAGSPPGRGNAGRGRGKSSSDKPATDKPAKGKPAATPKEKGQAAAPTKPEAPPQAPAGAAQPGPDGAPPRHER